MGQELGRVLVNFGKPDEVIADEDVKLHPSTAEGQADVQIPTLDCETQQCLDEDQRTGGLEEGKEKTGACSEVVVALQTDDSKIAQILERKEYSKSNNSTKHVTNSGVTGHWSLGSSHHKGSGITTDLLDLKSSATSCKAIQSEFVDESIEKSGAIQLIRQDIPESRTKNVVKRYKKLQSIVIAKNEPVRKLRKEQEWNNWEGAQRKYKSQKSRSNRWSSSRSPELKTANPRSEYIKDVRSERTDGDWDKEQRTGKKFHRYCYHRKRSLNDKSCSSSDTESSKNSRGLRYRRERHRKTGIHYSSTEHDFYVHEDYYNNAMLLSRRSTTPDSSCFTVESSKCYELECESGGKQKTKNMVVESQMKRNLMVGRMSSDRRRVNQDCGRLDAKVRKIRRQQKMHKVSSSLLSKSIGDKCSSDIASSPELIGKSDERIQNKLKNYQRNICFLKAKTDPTANDSPVSNDSRPIDSSKDNPCARPNKALRGLHGKLADVGKARGTSDFDVLHAHSKHKKEKFHRKYSSWQTVLNKRTNQAAKTNENGLNGHPQVYSSVQNPVETLNHSNISCFSHQVAAGSSLKTRIVELNPNLNAMKSKPANLNASVTKAPASGSMPSIIQKRTIPPPVLTKCLSSAHSSEDINHRVEKLGVRAYSGSFGMEKQANIADNRKCNKVPNQKKHKLSTSLEDTKVTSGASNRLPSMFELQIQLLSLSQALSLALSPVIPLTNKDPRNLQQGIFNQLLSRRSMTPPQRPMNPRIGTWNKPLSDCDAPSPYSDELVSFSPPLPKDIDSCKEVNKVCNKQKKSSTEFGQQTSIKKNSTRKKWENSDRLKKTVEAVKEVVLPLFTKRQITKDEYKQVMRVVVPKIFHCKTEFSRESVDRHVQLCVRNVFSTRTNL